MRFVLPFAACALALVHAPTPGLAQETPPELRFSAADSVKLEMIGRILARSEGRLAAHPELVELMDLGQALGKPDLVFEGIDLGTLPDSTWSKLLGLTRRTLGGPGGGLCDTAAGAVAAGAPVTQVVASALLAQVDSALVEDWISLALESAVLNARGPAVERPPVNQGRAMGLMAKVIGSLPPDDQQLLGIMFGGVGEAGDADLYGICQAAFAVLDGFYGLPPAEQVELARLLLVIGEQRNAAAAEAAEAGEAATEGE